MIELCNKLDADMWVNIPHLATDDYVNQLADLIKTNLDADLRVWVELSNELWNGQFSQTQWLRANASIPGNNWQKMAHLANV